MLHNAEIIKLGSHGSTDLTAECEVGSVGAALVCHRKSDGSMSLLATDGEMVGVSLGESLSDEAGKIAVAKSGQLVPVQVTAEGKKIGNLTFVPKVLGVSVEFLVGGVAGAEVVTVVGKKISVSMNVASTATQLKAALDASVPAMELLVSTTIEAGQGAVAQAAFAETAIPVASYVVPGAALKVSTTTGKATSTGTVTGAMFVSGIKTGIKLDASEVWCAYVDMAGGL